MLKIEGRRASQTQRSFLDRVQQKLKKKTFKITLGWLTDRQILGFKFEVDYRQKSTPRSDLTKKSRS